MARVSSSRAVWRSTYREHARLGVVAHPAQGHGGAGLSGCWCGGFPGRRDVVRARPRVGGWDWANVAACAVLVVGGSAAGAGDTEGTNDAAECRGVVMTLMQTTATLSYTLPLD